MEIYSAPLQGFTEAVWRNLHSEIFGGIDKYFTPFIRFEHGEIRNKDIRDIEKKNNRAAGLVPQLIAATPEEMQPLVRLIKNEGYREADINMGCSFPLQARKRHGAGILPHPDLVAALMREVGKETDISFSVKMRLGWDDKNEWKAIVDILNDAPLAHVTMHPRLGREQYRQPVDIDAFAEFYERCRHPVVYNGDLTDIDDIKKIESQFPRLQGVMLGRGLLANPALGREYKQGCPLGLDDLRGLVQKMHENLYRELAGRLQGNTQILGKLKPYWEYLLPAIEKRHRKAVQKANTVEKYLQAVSVALAALR